MIYITSDFHFYHDRGFIYEPRGFSSVEEMNMMLINNFNSIITPEDEVYVLGDLLLGGATSLEKGIQLISSLNGNLHLVRGNHDSETRWKAYAECHNVVEMDNAIYLKYGKYHFYLSHYPTYTGNLEKETLKQMTLNIHGHTHSKEKFYKDIPFMYCACVDAHNNFPVSLDDVIIDMKNKTKECYELI